MDDSDPDLVDFSPKCLKRVRKKPVESAPRRANESKGDKSGESNKQHGATTQPVTAEDNLDVLCPGDAGVSAAAGDDSFPTKMRAKDKVLLKMQQYKRGCPQKMAHDEVQPTNVASDGSQTVEHRRQENPSLICSDLCPSPLSTDEVLAQRLQQELDQEAANAQSVDLEDRGLFSCQICQRDLSHMTSTGRTQHLNRCLDESEQSGPAPPRPSGVPDCPICGKKFKSQKSRSAHLKRCSSEMGIAPAVLLQVLQRQAQEKESTATANTLIQAVGTKNKGGSKRGPAGSKKSKKKNEPLDEETMVALALSSSLQEQEKEKERRMELERPSQTGAPPDHNFMTSILKWKPDAGKGRGNKRKAMVAPPLLLVQDAEAAMMRLQERVSALLLRGRPPSPTTPTLNPSCLSGWTGTAPLWVKSASFDGEFYAAELKDFFTPTELTEPALSKTSNKTEFLARTEDEETPSSETRTSILPFDSQRNSSSSLPFPPGELSVGSQTLKDLMELAEDGMTLTQYGYTAKDLHLSGFIREEPDNQAELCVSGFLLEPNPRPLKDPDNHAVERTETEEKTSSHQSAALSKLTADLSGMVNNPQMSDIQLQVDGGEVYFAHSFMLYARCPLLAEMVHESGFGVQEEDMPAAQRVLLNDVSGEAVFALLRYLYTSQCCFSASLQPDMLELASRFDLKELEQLCHFHDEDVAASGNDEHNLSEGTNQLNNQTDQVFMELLRSMWNEDENQADSDEGSNDNDQAEKDYEAEDSTSRDINEEQVNEEELEEIYEFAATQRNRDESNSEKEDEEENDGSDELQDEDDVFTKLKEPKNTSNEKNLNPSPQIEQNVRESRSYSHLFSQSWGTYEEDFSSTASPSYVPKTPTSGTKNSPFKAFAQVPPRTPPVITNLPVIGVSPGLMDNDGQKALMQKSPGGPDLTTRQEPELIVLSDSSDEMEVFTPLQTCSVIPSSQRSKSQNVTVENKESSSPVMLNPDDCSPELSWLVPSTPIQPKTSSSSTQTQSSMCRTRLFPTVHASTHSSSLSSSLSQNMLSPHKLTGFSVVAHNNVSMPILNQKHLGSSDLSPKVSPEKICPVSKKMNPSHTNLSDLSSLISHPSSKKDNPLQLPLQPPSSTPLHAKLHQVPAGLPASPLHTDKMDSFNRKRKSSEKAELGSLHLSPLSSDSQSGQRDSKRQKSCRSSEYGSGDIEAVCEDVAVEDKEERRKENKEESNVEEFYFHNSFMDDPPIAFNDSWDLNRTAEANPNCFSLRLDDSLKHPETATSSSSISKHLSTYSPKTHQTPSSPQPHAQSTPTLTDKCLLDSEVWDSWDEDGGEECLPLSQRIKPAPHKTPVGRSKKRPSLVPITPMPLYSDMDTPELKNKLNRFGVRPLPKRQMILKLKEIHQYTHQLASSESEEDSEKNTAQMKPLPSEKFKAPRAPASVSPVKFDCEENKQQLPASQSSHTSQTATSEESERSNPEVVISSDGDSDSDGGISSSQAASRLQERLQAVRTFILSDSKLYNQILQYQPLVLSQLQDQLKAAGIRLGAAKLVDYLDSQCITFTMAKPGQPAPSRRRVRKPAKATSARGKKKVTGALL